MKIPVSVKTRLGWDTHETLIPFCQKMVEAGASALSIHGRRYHENSPAKPTGIRSTNSRKNISVPVIGNGDIASAQDAVEKIGNLDGVMVGRGTFGNPWVMREIVDALRNGKAPVKREWTPEEKLEALPQKVPFILEHCELSVRIKGEKRGVLEMRRHLSSYVKGFDGAKELRIKVLTMEKFDDVKAALAV